MLIDISTSLKAGMAVWPADPLFRREVVLTVPANGVELAALTMSSHSGTHVDAPAHFLVEGARIEELSLEALVGPAYVVEATGSSVVSREQLQAVPAEAKRILVKTDNGRSLADRPFNPDFVGLSPKAAEWLADRGTLLVGIDYLSVEPFHAPKPEAHLALLGANVVILEGLALAGVEPGWYELLCLPLKIEGGEGAPARAVLRTLG